MSAQPHKQPLSKNQSDDHKRQPASPSKSGAVQAVPDLQRALQDPNLASPGEILQLQKTAGNSAVSGLIQARLRVGPMGDAYEQQADRMAEHVMRNPAPEIQRRGMPEEEELLQGKRWGGGGFSVDNQTRQEIGSQQGQGAALPATLRAEMEARFGADFGAVRVHSDARAAHLNKRLRARAFTHQADIYFDAGTYEPGSAEGKRLLAHELTHVVQQNNGAVQPHQTGNKQSALIQRQITDADIEAQKLKDVDYQSRKLEEVIAEYENIQRMRTTETDPDKRRELSERASKIRPRYNLALRVRAAGSPQDKARVIFGAGTGYTSGIKSAKSQAGEAFGKAATLGENEKDRKQALESGKAAGAARAKVILGRTEDTWKVDNPEGDKAILNVDPAYYTLALNDAFMQGGIDMKAEFGLATKLQGATKSFLKQPGIKSGDLNAYAASQRGTEKLLWSDWAGAGGQPSVASRELGQLLDTGYRYYEKPDPAEVTSAVEAARAKGAPARASGKAAEEQARITAAAGAPAVRARMAAAKAEARSRAPLAPDYTAQALGIPGSDLAPGSPAPIPLSSDAPPLLSEDPRVNLNTLPPAPATPAAPVAAPASSITEDPIRQMMIPSVDNRLLEQIRAKKPPAAASYPPVPPVPRPSRDIVTAAGAAAKARAIHPKPTAATAPPVPAPVTAAHQLPRTIVPPSFDPFSLGAASHSATAPVSQPRAPVAAPPPPVSNPITLPPSPPATAQAQQERHPSERPSLWASFLKKIGLG